MFAMLAVMVSGFVLVIPDFLWSTSGVVFLAEIPLFSVIRFAVLPVVFPVVFLVLFSFRPLMAFFEWRLKGRQVASKRIFGATPGRQWYNQ